MWRITYLRNKKEDPWSLLTDLASVRRQICLASKLDFGVKTPTGNIQRLRWGGLHLTYGSTIIVVRWTIKRCKESYWQSKQFWFHNFTMELTVTAGKKQYNAHTNIYLADLGIPREKLQQECFIRFCSTSPYASALEQLEVLEKETGVNRWIHTIASFSRRYFSASFLALK